MLLGILQTCNKPNQHQSFDKMIQENPNKLRTVLNVKPGRRSKELCIETFLINPREIEFYR